MGIEHNVDRSLTAAETGRKSMERNGFADAAREVENLTNYADHAYLTSPGEKGRRNRRYYVGALYRLAAQLHDQGVPPASTGWLLIAAGRLIV